MPESHLRMRIDLRELHFSLPHIACGQCSLNLQQGRNPGMSASLAIQQRDTDTLRGIGVDADPSQIPTGANMDRVVTDVNISDATEYRALQQVHQARADLMEFPSEDAYQKYHRMFDEHWELVIDLTGYRWIIHEYAIASKENQTLVEFLKRVLSYEGRYGEDRIIGDSFKAIPVTRKKSLILQKITTTRKYLAPGALIVAFIRFLIKLRKKLDARATLIYGRNLRTWRTLGYGTPEARSYRNLEKRSVVTDFSHPDFRKPGYMIFFAISLAFFFSIPTSCLRQILDVDRRRFPASGISETRWRKFLQTRLEDWSNSNLLNIDGHTWTLPGNRYDSRAPFSRLYFRATVAFIAIPGIDDQSRALVLLSALLSIGSVLMGQYLIRIHESQASSNAQTGLSYFRNVGSTKVLAVLLSLPMILISWAFITFVIAFVIFSIRGNDGSPEAGSLPLFTRLIVLIATGTLACLLVAIIIVFHQVWKVTSTSQTPLKRSILARVFKANVLESPPLLPLSQMPTPTQLEASIPAPRPTFTPLYPESNARHANVRQPTRSSSQDSEVPNRFVPIYPTYQSPFYSSGNTMLTDSTAFAYTPRVVLHNRMPVDPNIEPHSYMHGPSPVMGTHPPYFAPQTPIFPQGFVPTGAPFPLNMPPGAMPVGTPNWNAESAPEDFPSWIPPSQPVGAFLTPLPSSSSQLRTPGRSASGIHRNVSFADPIDNTNSVATGLHAKNGDIDVQTYERNETIDPTSSDSDSATAQEDVWQENPGLTSPTISLMARILSSPSSSVVSLPPRPAESFQDLFLRSISSDVDP
ncbi:hypothetical protein SISSUDRAFT_1038335 [Sistotremastrum suecicum HHB10207 ss-3]|uniref:Uncharacterized protein n=1 Tax=Sistotremastrum suecicum HHB10207 ss-3 TaxID=1314776 RepID=A0A165WWU9_9AGAM|nr:hypothetical protein SISSUDRAFT_1038335 [Sistotremastrum suecicum HHB10207 ss-3]